MQRVDFTFPPQTHAFSTSLLVGTILKFSASTFLNQSHTQNTIELSYRKVKLTSIPNKLGENTLRLITKKSVLILILSLMLQTSVHSAIPTANSSPTATVYVNPSEVTDVAPGDTFSINIDIANVAGLAGWEIKLYYERDVLNTITATEGQFLKSVVPPHNTTMFIPTINPNWNATHGRVYLGCTLWGQGPGASGSGTLASITFEVVGVGQTPLSLPQDQTILVDPNVQDIPHTTVGGSVIVGGNDIAVTHLHLSKTITNDTTVQIDVTVQNNGDLTVSEFNVILKYDENEIETRTVTDLTPESSLNLIFTWDTTPVPKGNYTIEARVPQVVGEVLVENNELVGWIKETIMGDLNGDGQVNILDISLVAVAFGTRPGETRWAPNADINNDDIINILDISTVAIHFGEVDP